MKLSQQERSGKLRVGVHTSIAGGVSKSVERAAALDCSTMQIFSHSPRQWQKSVISAEEARQFVRLRKKYHIDPVFIHASYLINLASLSDTVLNKSIDLLSYELDTADALGVDYVVLHTGSASGDDERKARKRAAGAILKAAGSNEHRASIILENTAGQRGDITSSVRELGEVIGMSGCSSIAGICIDTCHAFSSGYDLRTREGIDRLFSEVGEHIGLDKLKLIHLNDSKKPAGSGIDRHEHVGEGFIGIAGFSNILSDKRITRVPLILETPKKTEEDDRKNLKTVFDILNGRTAV